MSRYIDKEVLLERMNRTRPYEGEDGSFERHRRLQWLADMEQVNMCPAADVAEVVRCKDCIHYMPYDWMFSEVRRSENIEDYPQDEIGCEWIDHHINPEGYCSYGERKDG